jgi:hypothetical protein
MTDLSPLRARLDRIEATIDLSPIRARLDEIDARTTAQLGGHTMLVPIEDLYNGTVYVNSAYIVAICPGKTGVTYTPSYSPCTLVHVTLGGSYLTYHTIESIEDVATRVANTNRLARPALDRLLPTSGDQR